MAGAFLPRSTGSSRRSVGSFRSLSPLRRLGLAALAAALSLLPPAAATFEIPIDEGMYTDVHPALGVADDFGRWNGSIPVVYDPDGAPAAYDSAKVRALLEETFSYWTTVSGVRFDFAGVDSLAPDDRNVGNPSQRDGLVRVSWGAIGGVAGRAGPLGGFFDEDLGYFPYEDGTIELNNAAGVITSDDDLVAVLVHEVGHLIGLGHSDNPASVMYANPYNFLRYPREDDIRAAQVLYGPPATAIDVQTPIPAWIYTAPPQASASATQFLFKPNAHPSSESGAYFRVASTTVTSVTASTADNEFVVFAAGVGGSSSAVSVDATFVVVDPSGYVYAKQPWTLNCAAGSACVEFMSVAQTQVIKTIPGAWMVYVVNEATNQTLASAALPVNTSVSFNRPPAATLTAVAGSGPATASFTVSATDPENDGIEVVWHPPGLVGFSTDLRDTFASGGSASRTVNFSLAGTHTFFVEVRDNGQRYGDGPGASAAGEGFQTLLRVTVTLPGATVEVASTEDTGTPSTSLPSQQMLAATARTRTPMLVANFAGVDAVSNNDIALTYGASSDQGLTTRTNFTTADSVLVAGGVAPQASDLGKAADLFIVVRTTINGVDAWYYRNANGGFTSWPSVALAQLQPAYTVSSLQANQAFLVYNGALFPAQFRIYIGYRPAFGSTLYYTGQPHSLTVTN